MAETFPFSIRIASLHAGQLRREEGITRWIDAKTIAVRQYGQMNE